MAPGAVDVEVAPFAIAEWASSAIAEARKLLLNIECVILLNGDCSRYSRIGCLESDLLAIEAMAVMGEMIRLEKRYFYC